uniref:WD_REPEATS_REGION domain-containing protein n=1 Tax=Caenorhabditis tropicalis TaxID=1561998 RepID=A0A1I7TF54_9PELO
METGSSTATKMNDETLSIQHDWHLELKEPVSQFYLGIKPTGANKTQYFDCKITKLVDEHGFAVMPGEGPIKSSEFSKFSLDEQNRLSITFQNRKTTFVSSSKEWTMMENGSAPRTFDVSSTGGTMVAANAMGDLVVMGTERTDIYKDLCGHVMDIYRCQFFPSGLVVLGGGMDCRIRIWAIDTGLCVRTLEGHKGAITGLGTIDVGKDIISCSNDGTAKIWNCGSAGIQNSWDFQKGKCVDLAVSEDSSRFAVICEENHLSIINLHGNKDKKKIPLPSEPSSLCFSSDASVVFVGFENGHVAAWKEGKMIGEILTGKGRVNSLKFHRNRLIVAFNDGGVYAYFTPSLQNSDSTTISAEYVMTGANCDPVYDLAIHGDNVYTTCRDGKIRMYKLNLE